VKSSQITSHVRAFFTGYCTAFIRLDAPAIMKHFADQVHIASETGDDVRVQVATAAEWRKTIDKLLDMYRAVDFGGAEVTAIETHPLSSRLVQALLTWSLRNRAGDLLYEFDAVYTLARHDERFRIISIAHNEIPQYRRCLAQLRSQGSQSSNTHGESTPPVERAEE